MGGKGVLKKGEEKEAEKGRGKRSAPNFRNTII